MSRLKISYNTLVYSGEHISEGIARLAKFGYDGVDFVGEPDQYDTGEIKRLLNQHDIEASSICAIFNEERNFVSSTPSIRKNTVAYVKQCVDFAEAIGAKHISISATTCMRTASEAPFEQEWEWAVEGIREAGVYAAEHNIRLTLEAWNRYETYFINRMEQALKLVNDVNLDSVGCMADTYHMNIEEVNIGDALRSVGDKLYYVHIADSNRAAPGRGHINFEEVAQALKDINYQGWIAMELLPAAADPFSGIKSDEFYDQYTEESIVFLNQLFQQ